MSDRLIPADATVAAKRAGIRTAAQALSSAIPTTGVVVVLTGDWVMGVLLGALSALATALMAGTQAYLSILSKGIPEDYAPIVDGGTPRRALTPEG